MIINGMKAMKISILFPVFFPRLIRPDKRMLAPAAPTIRYLFVVKYNSGLHNHAYR